MLTVADLSVRIGEKTIVQPLSMACRPGEWWMLVGPNGAGKSTLLGALSGTIPFAGHVSVLGQRLTDLPVRRRAQLIGMLTQSSSVNVPFTAEQIVAMGRYSRRRGLFGADEADLPQRVQQALELTGMMQQRRQSMLTLSGGERQRVFLSQVFCQDPQVLLLDEPANHLDLVYQKQIFGMIDQWRRQPGRLVISVVHDLNLARRYGTHALLMDRGSCISSGPVGEVLTDERLNQVWHMDVRAWREELHESWNG